MRPAPSPWLVCTRPRPAATTRLFRLRHAGGAASMYRAWSDGLPSWMEVWALEPPGRARRMNEPAFTSSEPLVEALIEVLHPALNGRYALFGHSMGALLAFEA